MTQLAENLAADPAWDNVLKMPPRVEGANPILDAPVTDVAYEPPPDVLLNRPEPKKRQRKAKGTGKKPGRPPRTKAPEPIAESPAPAQPLLATPPHGDALPKLNRENVLTLATIVWLVVGFGSGVGACYLMWGPVL